MRLMRSKTREAGDRPDQRIGDLARQPEYLLSSLSFLWSFFIARDLIDHLFLAI